MQLRHTLKNEKPHVVQGGFMRKGTHVSPAPAFFILVSFRGSLHGEKALSGKIFLKEHAHKRREVSLARDQRKQLFFSALCYISSSTFFPSSVFHYGIFNIPFNILKIKNVFVCLCFYLFVFIKMKRRSEYNISLSSLIVYLF